MKTKEDFYADGQASFKAGEPASALTSRPSWQALAFHAGYETAKAEAADVAAGLESMKNEPLIPLNQMPDFAEIERRVIASMPPEYVEALKNNDPRWLYGTFDESTQLQGASSVSASHRGLLTLLPTQPPMPFQQIGRAWRMPGAVVAHIADLRRQLETEGNEKRVVRLKAKISTLQAKYAKKPARVIDFQGTVTGRFPQHGPHEGARPSP